MSALFPDQVTLDADEVLRVQRVQLAVLLHKTPAEIDAMSVPDVADVMQIWAAHEKRVAVKKPGLLPLSSL